MKIHLIYILVIVGILGVAFATRTPKTTDIAPSFELKNLQTLVESLKKENSKLKKKVASEAVRSAKTTPKSAKPEVLASDAKSVVEINGNVVGLTQAENKQSRRISSWRRRQSQSFDEQVERFDDEDNPAMRMRLIQQLAYNVRRDTLSTVDWAMGLEDPEEQKIALEAINRNALIGIGATLVMDDTGLPLISNTLELGAVASSGLVESGDRILGMVDSDGSTIYFKGRSMSQIVALLRGQAGTEVRLLMKRNPGEGNTEATTFEVPVQRSMLIIQPPSG